MPVTPADARVPLLAGTLSGFALADVLQLLELGARSGVLRVDGGPLGGGSVRIRDGQVIEATSRGGVAVRPGDHAGVVADLLEIAAGQWAFHAVDDETGGHALSARPGLRISAILMDAARRSDEGADPGPGDDDEVPQLAADALRPEQSPVAPDVCDALTAGDLRILAAVDGERDVRAIAGIVRREVADVSSALATLRQLGIVGPRALGRFTTRAW